MKFDDILQSFCKVETILDPKASERDREICLCKLHKNPKLKIKRLYAERLLKSRDIKNIIQDIVCYTENKSCMDREYDICKGRKIKIQNVSGKIVHWKV